MFPFVQSLCVSSFSVLLFVCHSPPIDAHACTDVTGFGILGHLDNLVSNQTLAVEFHLHTLPILRGMCKVNTLFDFKLTKGFSAETSGEGNKKTLCMQ